MKVRYFLLLSALLFTLSCNKDDDDCCDPTNPDCSNYNPCHNASEVTADFLIYESHGSYNREEWIPYDTDTLWPINATFIALEEEAEYTWIIGSETLHTKEVTRDKFPVGQNVPITLIVKKEPNLQCFPNDDGLDTLTRNLFVLDANTNPMLVEGTFRGANADDPNNLFDVIIDFNSETLESPMIHGLPFNCGTTEFGSQISMGYKQFYFGANWTPKCNFPTGLAKVEGNEIIIDYTITVDTIDFSSARVTKKFKGVRIP